MGFRGSRVQIPASRPISSIQSVVCGGRRGRRYNEFGGWYKIGTNSSLIFACDLVLVRWLPACSPLSTPSTTGWGNGCLRRGDSLGQCRGGANPVLSEPILPPAKRSRIRQDLAGQAALQPRAPRLGKV